MTTQRFKENISEVKEKIAAAAAKAGRAAEEVTWLE